MSPADGFRKTSEVLISGRAFATRGNQLQVKNSICASKLNEICKGHVNAYTRGRQVGKVDRLYYVDTDRGFLQWLKEVESIETVYSSDTRAICKE
jgi:hypothetical protein